MTSLEQKTVVVIGGTSGIGFAVAAGAAAEGARVVIGSATGKKVTAAVERVPGTARGLQVNVTDESSVARFFAEIGPFDHLAFTAGDWNGTPLGTPAEVDVERFGEVMAVRLLGAIRAVKYGCRSIDPAGSITLTSGAVTYRPRKGLWSASPVTGAVSNLATGLAVELAPVRVNVVSPGFILNAPEDERAALNEMRVQYTAPILERLPVSRSGQPFEAAEAYLYLMKSTYTTGQEVRVDGGYSLV
jgi:NAD(P)-dependent dehydrogenase (short-subunit alcohol dehydrogenase family)